MKTLFFLVLAIPLSYSFGQDSLQELQEENARLKERVSKLENTITEIQKSLGSTTTPQEQKLKPELEKENSDLVQRLDQVQKTSLQTKFEVKLYGYIKLDANYDLARSSVGNYHFWVESEESLEEDDDQFNLTANQTRLGLDFKTPAFLSSLSTGKIEIDFYGGGRENASLLRMRQAYLKWEWPNSDFSILAGQTWDVISPLNPNTLNFLVQCNAGNLGYRRPQVRFTKGLEITKEHKTIFEFAITRMIGHSNTLYPEYLDSGEDAGFPAIQGRWSWEYTIIPKKPIVVGISGHWGQEEYDLEPDGSHDTFDSWSLSLDIAIPLAEKWAIKAELWTGKNLDSYLAGIGQGINTSRQKEISSSGGWLSLEFAPFDSWRFVVGCGIDDPENADLDRGQRTRNWSAFGNVVYSFSDFLEIGMELSYWDTSYKEMESGTNLRIQTAMTYRF